MRKMKTSPGLDVFFFNFSTLFSAFSNSQKARLGVRVREGLEKGLGVWIGLSYKNSTLTIVTRGVQIRSDIGTKIYISDRIDKVVS